MPCETRHNNLFLRQQHGFTLVELLVVAVVVAIFAAIVVPQFASTADESKVAALRADLAGLRKAIQLYHQQHGHYPGTIPSAPETCNGSAMTSTFSTKAETLFNAQLTLFTSIDGKTCPRKMTGFGLGPYLKTNTIPENPITGNRAISFSTLGTLEVTSGSTTGGWKFDQISGRLIADHADYEHY